MRSRLTFLATAVGLSVAVTAPGFSQGVGPKNVPVPPMEFGILGGVNVFTFGGADASGVKSRTSFFAGASLTVPLGQMLFVEPQAVYSGKGATADIDVNGTIVNGALKLAYLEVPVLLGVNLSRGEASGVRIFAGPAVGFKVSCTISATVSGVSSSQDCGSGVVKSTDFGVTGGAGFSLHLNRFNLNLAGRYTLGLAKVDESGGDIKNRGFSIGAGLSFPFRRK
jgi:hypothetical protein